MPRNKSEKENNIDKKIYTIKDNNWNKKITLL